MKSIEKWLQDILKRFDSQNGLTTEFDLQRGPTSEFDLQRGPTTEFNLQRGPLENSNFEVRWGRKVRNHYHSTSSKVSFFALS